jgi:hypothetical protein
MKNKIPHDNLSVPIAKNKTKAIHTIRDPNPKFILGMVTKW